MIVALLTAFVSVLAVDAYISAHFTADAGHISTSDTDEVPGSVIDGGPIIDTLHGNAKSYRLPPKTIAITFDDGPDPRWSPPILRVLRRHKVNATFFVVGSRVAQNPGLVREMVAAGDEIGIHTFTHPEMSQLSGYRRQVEISQTQSAIAGAAGVKTALLRFPYSSSASAVDNTYWPLIKEAGGLGYLTVMTDTDSDDWQPGLSVKQIVRNSIPKKDRGAVLLMHDAGGDRARTVSALDHMIPSLQKRGYRFVTVSQGLSMALNTPVNATSAAGTTSATSAAAGGATTPPDVAGNDPARGSEQFRGKALVWSVGIATWSLKALGVLFVLVGVLTLLRTVLMFVFAGRHARRRRSRSWSWGPPVTGPVSVIVPAYNEKEGIEAAVRSLALGDHPGGIEVVVVDDGSSDNTADLARGLNLPNVRVVTVPNGGKSTALNVGVAHARHDLIVMVDGDTVFEPDSLRHLVQPFADPEVGAVAGNVKVGNRSNMVARWQHIEYVIGFNLDRRMYDLLHCMPTVPGAIGAFRREALREAGGMSDDTLAEDTDLTMALARNGWHVVYEERARAWTEAPVTLSQLWKQRYRWSYGTMQAMWKHRHAVVERGTSGRFGRRGLPFLALFQVALPLFAPLFDILSVYGLFFFNTLATVAAWSAMLLIQFVTAVVAFRLDKEKLRALWALPLQQFVYRQMMYLVIIQSTVTAVSGTRLRWHKLHRTGQAAILDPGGARG
jgi:cellulose synthase/poly-beta-1,6-N-acetylglucosamine synthase-like glycosyltransferase/peptidoglycan/xylan/chitin deacetylase (PgdA/CDA1 family)